MKLAAKLSVGTEFDVDALVEAEPYEIQRLLHRTLFLCRHSYFSLHFTSLSLSLPLPLCVCVSLAVSCFAFSGSVYLCYTFFFWSIFTLFLLKALPVTRLIFFFCWVKPMWSALFCQVHREPEKNNNKENKDICRNLKDDTYHNIGNLSFNFLIYNRLLLVYISLCNVNGDILYELNCNMFLQNWMIRIYKNLKIMIN